MADDAAGISVGSVSVSVVPSAEGLDARLEAIFERALKPVTEKISRAIADALSNQRGAAQAGEANAGAFADAFKARLAAAFQSLPKAEIDADSTEADRRIQEIRAELEELSGKTIGVDISDGEALAKVAALKAELDEIGTRSPSIQVQADTEHASEQLAEITGEAEAVGQESPTIRVNADTSSAEGGISTLLALIVGLGPALVPVGAAAVGALGGIATVAAAGAAGLGVLTLGISDVANAVKLLGTEQTASAAAAAQSAAAQAAAARQQAAAAASVVSATEALKNAQANAASQEIAASEAVVRAKYAEVTAAQQLTNAQTAENDAREQAIRDLESYADQQIDANLSVQQSQIDLTNAQAQYQADQANPTVTPLQLQQDALNVAKAQQALVEAQQQAANATADNNKAQQEGVAGAPGVVSAAQAVAAAKHNQLSAEQALTDAIRNQSDQQRQSAYSVQAAENSLSDAMRAQANAAEVSASATQTALAKVQAQLAATNPAVLALAELVKNTLEPAFKSLQDTAAAGLAPGFEAAINNLKPLFQPLEDFIGGLAKTIGGLAADASKALTDPFWVQFFAYVASTAGPTLDTFARIIGDLATGFAGLIEAFQPVTDQIGHGLADLAADFSQFGQAASSNAGFQSFIDYIQQNGPLVVDTLGKVFDAIGHIVEALAPIGPVILEGIGKLADLIDKIPLPVLTEIAEAIIGIVGGLKLFQTVGPLIAALSDPLVLVGGAFALAYTSSKTFRDFINDNVIPVLKDLWAFIDTNVLPVLTSLWQFIKDDLAPVVGGILKDAFDGIKSAIKDIGDAIQKNRPQLTELLNGFKDLVGFIVDKVLPVLGPYIKVGIELLGKSIAFAVDIIGDLVKAFNWVKNHAKDAVDDVIGFFKKLPGRIEDAVEGLGKILLAPFKWAFDEIGKYWNETVGRIHFHLPGWVPGIGGDGFAMPTVPGVGGLGDSFDGVTVSQDGPGLGWTHGGTPPPFVHSDAEVRPLSNIQPVISGQSGGANAPYAVYVTVGDEPLTTKTVRVATGVVQQKVAAAQQLEGAGVPGSSLTHLAGV